MRQKPILGLATAVCVLLVTAGGVAYAASVESALQSFREGYYELAAHELKTVVAADPADLGATYWLARCEIATGDFVGAENRLQALLTQKPNSIESRYWLAEALAAQGRVDDAVAAFKAVLQLDPDHEAATAAIGHYKKLADHVIVAETGGFSGFAAEKLSLDVNNIELYSSNVYDYTFSQAPTDWLARSGLWNATSRWTCSPQWSWYGGYSPDGIAAFWNKREFVGDVVVEMYFGFKMRLNRAPTYLPPNDVNISICGDGANPDSGYSFVIGGDDNRWTRIYKGTQVLAETRELAGLWPILEDGQPGTYEWHRKWWGVRVRKSGGLLQVYLDNKLVLETEDKEPLPGGRVGLWTLRNDIITPRIKIYYEEEKLVRSPLPDDERNPLRAAETTEALFRLTSATHPSVQNGFEAGLDGIASRDDDQGAQLAIVDRKDQGRCLQLVNRASGGSFGANLYKGQFDATQMPILSFDYSISRDVKVNLHLLCGEQAYEIVFTGKDRPAPGNVRLGAIASVTADGQWRHATFDLLSHLQAVMPGKTSFSCSDLWVGNATNEDYLLAGFGGNPIRAMWYLDNFHIGRPGGSDIKLAIAPGKNDIKGYAVSVNGDAGGSAGEQVTTQERNVDLKLPGPGTWYAHVRPQLADGSWGPQVSYRAGVDAQAPVVAEVTPRPDTTLCDELVTIALADPGGSGIDVAALAISINDQKRAVGTPGITWDAAASALLIDAGQAGVELQDGASQAIVVSDIKDRAGNAAEPLMLAYPVSYAADKRPPSAPQMTMAGAYLVDDTFEENLGGWEPYGGAGEARLSLDRENAFNSQSCLRLFNPVYGGRFGAKITSEMFEAGKHRIVSFDYKCDDRLRADLVVYVNGDLKAIKFTDNDNNLGVIGTVPNVTTDGEWRHAEFDLYEMLKRDDPTAAHYQVRSFWIGDSGNLGNRVGATYFIDNFRIIPIVSSAQPLELAWRSTDAAGLAGVSWLTAPQGANMPERTLMAETPSLQVSLPDMLQSWISVRAQDRAGNWGPATHRMLLLDGQQPQASAASPPADAVTAVSETVINLVDLGPADVDPNSIRLQVGDKEYTIANEGLLYEREKGRLVWNCENVSPTPVVFADKTQVGVKLLAAADYAGNPAAALPAWAWTLSYDQDKTGPPMREVNSPTHPVLVAETFETSVGAWQNRGGNKGAAVDLDTTTAASGSGSVKLTNKSADGAMSALVYGTQFSAEQYPVVSFDYKIPSGVKIDFAAYMDGRWWPIGLTDGGSGAIGQVAGVKADDQWHHASFDLGRLLRAQKRNGPLTIEYLIVGDRNSMDNAQGAAAHFDNFIIGNVGTKAPLMRWRATDTTGIAGYSFAVDASPSSGLDETSEGLAVAKQFGELDPGVWFFHVRAQDGAGNWGPVATYPFMHGKP